jgi:hypothetical protein
MFVMFSTLCSCNNIRYLICRHFGDSSFACGLYRGADKSLAQPGRIQATATEDFDVHISYL